MWRLPSQGTYNTNMRSIPIACLCVFLIGCGSNKSSQRASNRGDGGTVSLQGCDALKAKVEGLYRKSAKSEEVSINLQSEYISANLHMVMKDCQRDAAVLPCLQRSKSVAEIESNCLLPLDDQGNAEAKEFSAQ